MAEKFRYLSHTADVEFVSFGADIKEAIENAGLALLNIGLDLKAIANAKASVKSAIIIESADTMENLVWFTLQDIISKRNAEYLNAFEFKIEKLQKAQNKLRLKGRLLYKLLDRDLTLLEVKAVTTHGLKISKAKNGYSINIVVDV